jgi:PAS domain S-box-containing protein
VREQLQLVTDVMDAPVSRCSRDFRFLWVSKTFADWIGRPPEDVIDRPILDIIGEEAFQQLRPRFEQVLSGDKVSYEEEVDYRGLGRRWINARYTPTVDTTGVVDGWVAVVLDITDRKRTEAALQDANRRKDEFLAMLSHELRNPLAPIRNAAHVLNRIGPVDTNVRKATEMIQRQVQHLTRLVDDLLDVSRITRGKIRLRKEPLELTTVVAQAVETSQPLIDDRRHELMVGLPPEEVRVEADLTRLAQALANILTNAAKYTPEGGHIRLTVETGPGEAVVRIHDDGMGIAPELLPRVFDLFTQGDRSLARSEGGLGIGLTLVQSLVALHGGSVEAHSEGPGKGSEFVVRLPTLLAKASPAGSEREGRHPSPPRRVLVVDDNEDGANSLAMLLQLAGHEVRAVHDGPTALDMAKAFRPDLVLLDIGMPRMDGYEVARQLRKQPGLEKALLVAVTGYGQEEDRRRTQEARLDAHLVKPVDFGQLEQVLAARPTSDGQVHTGNADVKLQ